MCPNSVFPCLKLESVAPVRISMKDIKPIYTLRTLLLGGIASGIVWSVFAVFLDDGWAIPKNNAGYALTILGAVPIGVTISLFSYPIIKNQGMIVNGLVAVISLPVAIALFSILIFLIRLLLGVEFSPQDRQGDFALIFQSYLVYGLFGGGIILFPLASLNHMILKRLCQPDAELIN